MSHCEIRAKEIDIEAPMLEFNQPLLLQVIIIFDADIFIDRELFIISFGAKDDYSGILKQLRDEVDSSMMVESRILYVKESEVAGVDNVSQEIKNIAESYLNKGASKVDIEIYIPTSSFRSINTALLVNRFDVNNEYIEFDINYAKIQFSSDNIQVTKICELLWNENGNELKRVTQLKTSDYPTVCDARVAAVLCEYTYYISRLNERNKKTLESEFPVNQLKRNSINKRADDISDEIKRLHIIPERWSKIVEFENVTYHFPEAEIPKEVLPVIDIYQELLKWDAIRYDSKGWLGMCEHKIDWKDSLSYALVKKINEDEDDRFSFVGNKGILNTWLVLGEGFSTALFVNEEDQEIMYCTAGSDMGFDFFVNGDWITTNFLQFISGLSPQYQQSVTNALILDRAVNAIERERGQSIKLTFIGHSLGGGLASNNAIVTKRRHAITFNAAGLNWMREIASLNLHNQKELLENPLHGRERVHLYVIKGEILDFVQSIAGQVIGMTTQEYMMDSTIPNVSDYRIGVNSGPQMTGYSSPWTRIEIDYNKQSFENANFISRILAPINQSIEKHSIACFLDPITQILKINRI